jgi:shikimate dehydrogenase
VKLHKNIRLPRPQYGLIGFPLTHTFSPAYFAHKFASMGIDAHYKAYPLTHIDGLQALITGMPTLRGLNVTIPYKESVMPLLHEIDTDAAMVGAVNCIDIKGGRTKGYNTDVIGFRESLLPLLLPFHTQALVLGTGGAAKAVAHVLGKLGINFRTVSRTASVDMLNYNDLKATILAQYKLIINCTPVGIYPHLDECPLPSMDGIGPHHLLYDLIYNPLETRLLQYGRELGAATKNGLEMLHLQAEASWDIWNKK